MSRYLIRRIEEHPAIVLLTRTQIVALEGARSLERIRWRDDRTGAVESHDIGHAFIMTGATPNSRWLEGCVALDDKGFVLTGPVAASATDEKGHQPLLLETSLPGVLAVGDVRSGSVKRVASAVGEGAMAVRLAYEHLQGTGQAQQTAGG